MAWTVDRPWRDQLKFGRDWAGILVLLIIYNFSRGYADNGVQPHVTEMINADSWLFGGITGGSVPTIWLQQHLYRPQVQWYDLVVSVVYLSHFLATPAIATILYLKNRAVWRRFVAIWFTLSALGVATYFAFPAAPPWWAAESGYLPPVVHGVATRGWYAIGMAHGGNLLNAAKLDSANQVAAMPSLHSAFALFVALFFLRRVPRGWRPVLLAYPLAMAFTLVYAGEHYAIDVLVGWAYALASFGLVEVARRVRRAGRPDDPAR